MTQINQKLKRDFTENGFVIIPSKLYNKLIQSPENDILKAWLSLSSYWDDLVVDEYLKKAGLKSNREFGTRKRRFAAYQYNAKKNELEFNNYCTDFHQVRKYVNLDEIVVDEIEVRRFELLTEQSRNNSLLKNLIITNLKVMSNEEDCKVENWNGFVHFVRVYSDGENNSGFPSPEGIHRDNHYFLAMHLISKTDILGGESRIYNHEKQLLKGIILDNSLDTILIHDEKVLHDVTPIYSENGKIGYRDVLIIDYQK